MAVPIQPGITCTAAPENPTNSIAALTAVTTSTVAITDPMIFDDLTVTIPGILTGVILEILTGVISATLVTIPTIPALTDTGSGNLTGKVTFTDRTHLFIGTTGDI